MELSLVCNEYSASVLIIVIMYKKKPHESETLTTLSRVKNIKNCKLDLKVIDNSECGYISNQELLSETSSYDGLNSIELISKYSNDSLGKIYNDIIKSHPGYDYYNILDDDSLIPTNYYEEFICCAEQSASEIFIPKIFKSRTELYSPKNEPPFKDFLNRTWSKNFRVDFAGMVTSTNLFAVMSGLFICSHVFRRGFKFNERLKLYGLDNQLFLYIQNNNISCDVLPISFGHSPSYLNNSEDLERVFFRFQQRSISKLELANQFHLNPLRVKFGIILSSLSLTVKYRSGVFVTDLAALLNLKKGK